MVRCPAWRLGLASVALALAGAGAAQTHHGGHGGSATESAAPRVELGAAAAFDSKGALWAAYKEGGHVMVRRSNDFGRAWSKPVPANATPEAIEAGSDSRPHIATGPGGEIYVTWTKPLGKFHTGDIRFSRSVDGGQTFSPPVTINTDRQQITHRFNFVTVNRDGKLFVAWIDNRDGVAAAKAKGPEYRGAAVYFAVSDDNGASFRGDFKLADHSCECCRIALLPRDDGSVLALWRHVFAPNIRDHAIAQMYPDGRAGKVRRATFDDWHIDACPHHGPSLAADATGRLHAVWFSQAPGGAGAFYGRLRDGGVDNQRRIGGETAEHPDLAIAGQRVAVAWKEFDGERSRLRAMVSDSGGESWQERELAVTSEASDQPHLLVHQDRFYVFWNTRREPLSVVAVP